MALKTALLQILEEHRDAPVSGQALADRLHVSRAAVWKAMKALQAEGHRITAVTNRGYQLERDSDVLTPQGIRCRLRPAYQDCAIRVDARVPSTNTQAKKLAADGEAAPSLLLADGQTAGRGRMGRAFFSPPGTGLYMSVLLRPAVQAEELPLVTLAAAAAVCEAVEEAAGVSTRVKWVNDILVDGRKVAGILTEAVGDLESGTMESVVVGIGVNVAQTAFPPDIADMAASLAMQGYSVSPDALAKVLLTKPKLLLLDEITANLDAETERAVLRALKRAAADRTVLSISHRVGADTGRLIPIGEES